MAPSTPWSDAFASGLVRLESRLFGSFEFSDLQESTVDAELLR